MEIGLLRILFLVVNKRSLSNFLTGIVFLSILADIQLSLEVTMVIAITHVQQTIKCPNSQPIILRATAIAPEDYQIRRRLQTSSRITGRPTFLQLPETNFSNRMKP